MKTFSRRFAFFVGRIRDTVAQENQASGESVRFAIDNAVALAIKFAVLLNCFEQILASEMMQKSLSRINLFIQNGPIQVGRRLSLAQRLMNK